MSIPDSQFYPQAQKCHHMSVILWRHVNELITGVRVVSHMGRSVIHSFHEIS